MRHLLLLVVLSCAGQESEMSKLGRDLGKLANLLQLEREISEMEDRLRRSENLALWLATERNYRIDWLRPDLDLRPAMEKYNIGTQAHGWGYDGFAHIFVYAPKTAIIVLLPNGKRVEITRAEIEGRAK